MRRSGSPGLGVWEQHRFRGKDAVKGDGGVCCRVCARTTECTAGASPCGACGLGVTVTHQCRLVFTMNAPLQWGSDSGGGRACVGVRGSWEISSSNFIVSLKVL